MLSGSRNVVGQAHARGCYERRADVGSKERYAALSLYNLRKVMNHTIGSEIR